MFAWKGNKKKNHTFAFSTTLAILLIAWVAIYASVALKNAFAQSDPTTNCFTANAIINPSFYQSVKNFINSLPNDKLYTKISAETENEPIQNNADLYALLTNQNINHQNRDHKWGNMEFEIANLLAAAGFLPLQQNGINECIGLTDWTWTI